MQANRCEMINHHPCLSREAAHKYGRIHLPVAPRCNIKCKYCLRKFDCANESKPGISSMVLKPDEAMDRLRWYLERTDFIKVAAVAGPGEPLTNQQTFSLMKMIKEEFPELILCLSTNGLLLPDRMPDIITLGVNTLTVTLNAVNPEIGAKIYSYINYNGKTYYGIDAAKILLENQLVGIEKAVKAGIIVKINTIFIPEINGDHLIDIANYIKKLDIYLMNLMPLIPQSDFAKLSAPKQEELNNVRMKLRDIIPQMVHCKQCRADSCGKVIDGHSKTCL